MSRFLRGATIGFALVALFAGGCAMFNPSSASLSNIIEKPLNSRLALARLCERRGEDDKARGIYEGVLSNDPENPTALHRLAIIATKHGQFVQAKTLFDRAIAAQPPTAELVNDLGYHYFLQDRLAEAEEQFRKAVEIKPEYKPAWTNLGLALGQQERFKESRAAFQKSADSPAEVHCNLAYVYAQLRQLDKAQAEYRAALSLDPTLRLAAEGLLQVSAQMPGHEPVTVVSTVGHRSKRKDSEPADVSEDSLDTVFATQATMAIAPPPRAQNPQAPTDGNAVVPQPAALQRVPGGRNDVAGPGLSFD